MPIITDLPDLSALPPSPVHVPLFETLLVNRFPHDNDFQFFANFQGRTGLFIDVGANIGNSALSIHLIQPSWEVVSFEPNVSLVYFLERARQKLADDGAVMSFHCVGLGDTEGTLDFYIPKIDDWYVVGESSFNLPHFDNPVVKQRLSSYSPHGHWELARTRVKVMRFDDISSVNEKIAKLDKAAELVVKMDVEGYELSALKGMVSLIAKQRAIFMVEYSEDPAVDQLFVDHGYSLFDYSSHGNTLWRNDNRGLNTFYIPQTRLNTDEILARMV